MKKKNALRVCSAVVSVLVATTCFAGFAPAKKKAAAKPAKQKTLIFNLGSEPKSIDVSLCNAVDGSNVIYEAFEGLTKARQGNKIVPGVAEKWEISKDGLNYTFHLRKNAKWSDGKPVTAKDFYYSWTRLLDPKTTADYATQMFYVKNAKKIYDKKAPMSSIGLKVVDPYTFKVTLEAPTSYFLLLTSWANFYPQRQDIVSKNPTGWANQAKTYVGNGPFKLVQWKHKQELDFVKNPNYWNAKNVKIDKLVFQEITDNSAYLEAWEAGKIDVIQTPPVTEIPRLQKENKVQIDPQYGNYYVEFNMNKAPMNNLKFRQALSLAIDREGIVKAITKAGQKPATAFVPTGSFEPSGKDFRTVGGNFAMVPTKPNIEKAKQLLKESGVDLSTLDITYQYNTESARHALIAQALQQMWKQIGVNVKLQGLEWSVFQTNRTSGNYDIARAAWGGDYVDPMTFLDLFTKDNGNNDPKYNNANYEKYIDQAKHEADPAKRFKVLHQAENQLMTDLPVVPLFYDVSISCISPKVKGVYVLATSSIYFDQADITK